MKKLTTAFALLFLAGMIVLSGCKKKTKPEEKTAEELRIEALTGTWIVSEVTLDNSDVTSDWPSFAVTFGNKTYTTDNSFNTNVWPASGSYTFDMAGTEVDVNTMLRSGNGADLEIALNLSSNSSLTMSFNYDTNTHGRLKGTDGAWTFRMTKQ